MFKLNNIFEMATIDNFENYGVTRNGEKMVVVVDYGFTGSAVGAYK